MTDTALPAVLERADLGLIAPDDLVAAVGEEGRVEINEVHTLGRKLAEPSEVVVAVETPVSRNATEPRRADSISCPQFLGIRFGYSISANSSAGGSPIFVIEEEIADAD